MPENYTLDISWSTIVKVFTAGFIFYVLFLVRDIVVWFFFALMIALLVEPMIRFFRKLHIPKIVSVTLVYLSIFGAMGLLIYLISPIFVFEIKQLYQSIPDYFEKINPLLKSAGFNVAQNFEELTKVLASGLEETSKGVIKAISVFFGGISSALMIFLFAFYISLEDRGPEKVLSLLIPKKYEELALTIFEKAQFKVSGWFGARILACVFVGVVSFFVFLLFGTKYAFILSLVSGLLTFVPFIGPLITSLLVLLFVGVSASWTTALYIIIALLVIQEIENKIVTPLLMKKILDLPPVLVLIAIMVGGTIFGFLGIIFVVPVFGIIYEFLKEFLEKRKQELLLAD